MTRQPGQTPTAPTSACDVSQDIFARAAAMDFGDLHLKHDTASGLRAIIAIHNTRLGPALGGCRCLHYPNTGAALTDVMRLAQGMSYKAAMAGLPLGGGKAVIMLPEHKLDRKALFSAYGRFVDELGGRYISSVDSGTGPADMDIAAKFTRHVRSTSDRGDPSPSTALGVRHGIEAAVRHHLGNSDLKGIHVAVQGLGHVGYHLVRELHAAGAKLTVCDIDAAAVQRVVDEFGVRSVAFDQVYAVEADVFAPCALGGVINDDTLPKLKARIIAGASNNVLAEIRHADALHQRGILYAPDYVINAGGLMQVWIEDTNALQAKLCAIHGTLNTLFKRADALGQSPARVVDTMAEEILFGHPPASATMPH